MKMSNSENNMSISMSEIILTAGRDANIIINSPREDPLKKIKFGVMPPSIYFTGRDKELDIIRTELHTGPNEGTISKTVAVVGLGGVGKTEISKKYVHQQGETYKHAIWINAETRESMVETFQNLYHKIFKTSDRDKKIDFYVGEIYDHIGCVNETILIFDNAESFKDVEDFLPKCGPHNIFTLINSRHRDWDVGEKGHISVVELNGFSENEAILYIKTRLEEPEEEENDILVLAKELQTFPLGLTHAAGYINKVNKDRKRNHQIALFKVKNYLDEYKSRPETVLNNMDQTYLYQRTIYKTWDITMDKIRNDEQNGQCADNILQVLAYFDSVIRKDVFMNAYTKSMQVDDTLARNGLELLETFSMINVEDYSFWDNRKTLVISTHKVVQHVIRTTLKTKKEEENVVTKALRTLSLMIEPLGFGNLNHGTSVWKHAVAYEGVMNEFYPTANYSMDGMSPLHFFASNENEALKKIVLWEDYVDINCKDSYGRTPLHMSIESDNLEGVQYLLSKGADISFSSCPIFFLAKKDYMTDPSVKSKFGAIQREVMCHQKLNSNVLYFLIDRHGNVQSSFYVMGDYLLVDNNYLDNDFFTFMNECHSIPFNIVQTESQINNKIIHRERFKVINFICLNFQIHLRRKKKKIRNIIGNSIPRKLNLAAKSDNVNIVKYFIELGENPIDFDEDGQTATHIATTSNSFNVLKYLIEDRKIDVNIKNSMGETPLHVAASASNLSMVKYLIENKANIDAVDELGLTPIFGTISKNLSEFCGTDTLKFLLSKGAKTTCSEDSLLGKLGITLSHFAIFCNNVEAFELLKNKEENSDEVKNENEFHGDCFSRTFVYDISLVFTEIDKLTALDLMKKSLMLKTFNVKKNFFTNTIACSSVQYEPEKIHSALKTIIDNSRKTTGLKIPKFLDELRHLVFTYKKNIQLNSTQSEHFHNFDDDDSDSETDSVFDDLEFDSGTICVNGFESLISKAFDCQPPDPVPDFIGRLKMLNEVHELLQDGQNVIIVGMAGFGKSEFAKRYSQLHKDIYHNVLWIDATSRYGIVECFKELHRKIKLGKMSYSQRLISQVHQMYHSSGEKTLFIFDNAEDFETIEDFLPVMGSCVLITSRNRNWNYQQRRNLKTIELTEFTVEEIEDCSTNNEENKNIMKVLGYHPLSLKQAITYINEKEISNEEYLRKFNNYMTNTHHEINDYNKTCYVTWKIIFDEICDSFTYFNVLKCLTYFTHAELIVEDILLEQQHNFNLIRKFTSIRPFMEILKNHILEHDQEEENVIKESLNLVRTLKKALGTNIDFFTVDIWTQLVYYADLVAKSQELLICKKLLRLFVVNRNEAALTLLLATFETTKTVWDNFFISTVKYNFLKGIEIFMDFGIDINKTIDSRQRTLLHAAAVYNREEVIAHYAMDRNEHLKSAIDIYGRTALIIGINCGHIDIVDILTSDPSVLLIAKLYAAIMEDNAVKFTSIVKKFEWEHPHVDIDSMDEEIVLNSVLIEDENCVMKLTVKDCIDDHLHDLFDRRCTLLHAASSNGNLSAVRSILLKDIYTILDIDDGGNYAIHLAAMNGHKEIVKFFVNIADNGKDEKNIVGSTPLHLASLLGHIEVVKFLIQEGADVEAKDNFGATPEFYAAFGGNPEILELILDRKIRKATRDTISRVFTKAFWFKKSNDASVEVPVLLLQNFHITPLHVAVAFDNLEVAKTLIRSKFCLRSEEVDSLLTFVKIFECSEVFEFFKKNNVVTEVSNFTNVVNNFVNGFKLNSEYIILLKSLRSYLSNFFRLLIQQNNENPKYIVTLTMIDNFLQDI